MMKEEVMLAIADNNPETLAFLMIAVANYGAEAEIAISRMRQHGIIGDQLQILWDQCCDKNTQLAISIMLSADIDYINKHINYGYGFGIPFIKKK